jgi:hypothetical protein
MAENFLTVLDPVADKFTFQFFGEGGDAYAEIVHASLDEVWPKVQALNTIARRIGVFVTISETDFGGRRAENIVRPRALFVDADSSEQFQRCEGAIKQSGAVPTMLVRTSPERGHFYWVCDDLSLGDFTGLQAALIGKIGTDPAVKDLSRVMRLPGTLHLKEPNNPRLVRLEQPARLPRRWKLSELVATMGLSIGSPEAVPATKDLATDFPPADRERLRKLFGENYLADGNRLSAGLETNIEEIKSAVSAIPPSAISTEPEWVKFARGLAHEARIYKGQAEELWHILDTASAAASGYNEGENRVRWLRYIDEALNRQDPITVATVFALAKQHGWTPGAPGKIPSEVTGIFGPGISPSSAVAVTASSSGFGPSSSITQGLSVSFSNIPHRRWLYGIDLVRGEITLLASPGGVGKSSLAIGVAVSVATGRALLDEKVWGKELTVIYVNAEDSAVEMRRRIWAFCLKHSIAEKDLDRLLLLGADDWRVHRLSLLRSDRGASVLDDSGAAHLATLLEELRPDLIVLDPLVVLCGAGDMNDNAGMSLVMRQLKRLAVRFDCAMLILHHTRKGGDLASSEAITGASAIVNLARRALMAAPMTPEEAKDLGLLPSQRVAYFKVAASKSNLAPRSPDVPWYQLHSVMLPNAEPPTYPFGDGVQAVTRVNLPLVNKSSAEDQKIRLAILDLVDGGKTVDGEIVPYSPNVTGAKNLRGLLDDAMAVAQQTMTQSRPREDVRAIVERCIKSLKAEGVLVEDEVKSKRFRGTRGLRVDWTRVAANPKPFPAGSSADDAEEAETTTTGAMGAMQ